jgi:hypothetical protein
MKSMVTALLLVVSVIANAAIYEGDVHKSRNSIYITNKADNKKYLLVNSTAILDVHLNKLTSGDFASIEGVKNTTQNTITVKSINYVGLRRLLGSWVGNEPYCYNFVNYNLFTVTRKVGERCTDDLASEYTYLINPDTQAWVVLISGEYNSYVGDVHLLNRESLEIDLYDSESGAILRQLSLRKYKSENTTSTK